MVDDLVSTLRVACVLDPAIDRAKTDVIAYSGDENGNVLGDRDPERVFALPGESVRWFHIAPIDTQSMAGFVDAAPAPAARWVRAFQVAIQRIDAPEMHSGGPWLPEQTRRDPTGRRESRYATEAEVEEIRLRFGLGWIYEIGKVAYQRATEGNILGGGVGYTLPPTSAAGLTLIARRLAERARLKP